MIDQAFELEVLAEVMNILLDTRDFLGHQLNLEYGNITDAEFDDMTTGHFYRPTKKDPEALAARLRVILKYAKDPEQIDGSTIAMLFRCTNEDAYAAYVLATGG